MSELLERRTPGVAPWAAPADQPAAARSLAAAKRRPSAPNVDMSARYREAVAHVSSMPRYSTRSGRWLARDGRSRSPSDSVLQTWEWLGPGNIGGRTRVLVIHPRRHRIMWAAGVSGGIWKTTNRGRSWTPVGDSLANIAVNSMALHPDDPGVLYAGTGEGYFREEVRGTGLPLRGQGIFKSDDGGETWVHLDATDSEDFHWVNDLVFGNDDARLLYAATRTGVWRTVDGGETWQRILSTDRKGGCLDLEVRTDTAADVLFASCGTLGPAAVYRTRDAAAASPAWIEVLGRDDMSRTEVAIAPSQQDVVYALSASNDPGPGGNYEQGLLALFRSSSGGDPGTWLPQVTNADPTKAHTLLLTNPIGAMLEECGFRGSNDFISMGWYGNTLAVDPTNPDRVFAGSVDLFRSEDGGRTWGAISYWWGDREFAFAHADHHVLVFHPDYDGVSNRTLFTGSDGGVFRTDDAVAASGRGNQGLCDPANSAVRWSDLNRDYGVTQFYQGLPYPDGETYLGGTQDNGTIRSGDRSGVNGWTRLFGGDGGYLAVDPTDTDILYVSFQWASFRKSFDGGATFVPATDGLGRRRTNVLGMDGIDFLFITPLAMDPSDPRRLWTGGRRIYRTDDGMRLWRPVSRRLKKKALASAVTVSPSDPDRVAVGDHKGRVYVSRRATSATDTDRWRSKRPRRGWVTWLAFDSDDPDTLYATYGSFGGRHVYRSTNGGRRWTPLDGEGEAAVPDIPVHSLVVDPRDTTRIYLGTDLGVLVSTDGGATWGVENTGFGNIVTESLAVTETPSGKAWLFGFTHGRGAWRVPLD